MRDRSAMTLLLAVVASIVLVVLGGAALWRTLGSPSADVALTPDTAYSDPRPADAAREARQLDPPMVAKASLASAPGGAAAASAARDGADSPQPRSLFSGIPQCQDAPRVLASVVDVAHPERSFAAIRIGPGTYFVHEGEQIAGIELVKLRPARAYVQRRSGPLCVISVFNGERASAAPTGMARAKRTAPAGSPRAKPPVLSETELKNGIRPLGPGRYTISRELLERALGNVGALRSAAAFRVRTEGGRVAGLEVKRMRQNSILKHLGVKKGDVISKLNGHDLTNPGEALQVMKLIKQTDRFTLATVRNGTQNIIEYLVQ